MGDQPKSNLLKYVLIAVHLRKNGRTRIRTLVPASFHTQICITNIIIHSALNIRTNTKYAAGNILSLHSLRAGRTALMAAANE